MENKISPPAEKVPGGDCNCEPIECSRRDFFGKVSCAIFAALVSSGVAAGRALSFPVSSASAEAVQGSEHSYPLPSEDGASIDQVEQVILVRFSNRVYAFSLACPHQNVALKWEPKDQRFQCPRHHAKFHPDGTYFGGHRTRDMDRFALHLAEDKVVVDLTKLYRSDTQKTEWDSAVIALT